jgi:signal transduction histidine kinase/ActR/RegA family two-component response regulator
LIILLNRDYCTLAAKSASMNRVLIVSSERSNLAFYLKCNANNVDISVEQLMPQVGGDIIQYLSEQKIDVVILSACDAHWGSADFIVRLIGHFPKIAFLLACDKNDETRALSLLESGVQDYFLKERLDAFLFRKYILTAFIRRNLRNEAIESSKKEQEAREYSSRLLSRMSHEIRTPMNAIIGMAELLNDTALSSKQRYYLQLVRDSSNLLVGLFNDLLDFARIESGKVKIHSRPFSIKRAMQEVMESALPQALEKKINLLLHISPQLPEMRIGDDLRIRQVMMNLVDNAIKFTHAGSVRLHITAEGQADKQVLKFVVQDTGQGIKKEVIPQLFKALVKGVEHEAAHIKGIGLGLSICDHLVKRMNGVISVSSVLGKGTAFSVTLPLALAENQPEPENANTLKGKRFLYVTHDMLYKELLSDYCNYWEVKLEVVQEDQDLPVFTKDLEDYDLLITNLRPGFKLDLKLIDMVRKTREMPHILLKNRENVNDQLVVIRKDTVILLKPLQMDEFFETVQRVFEKKADMLNRREFTPISDERKAEYHPLEILVAEDNAINQKIILSVLSRYGYRPRLVENGKQALDAVLVKTYDLILMDIQMPVMGGVEACRLIRRRVPAESQPRIIALTADALLQSSEEYIQNGMDGVLYKPVQTKELLKVLTDTATRERNSIADNL